MTSQEIVEVVGDASRHASQCFHLLRLAKLPLEVLAVKKLTDHCAQFGNSLQFPGCRTQDFTGQKLHDAQDVFTLVDRKRQATM